MAEIKIAESQQNTVNESNNKENNNDDAFKNNINQQYQKYLETNQQICDDAIQNVYLLYSQLITTTFDKIRQDMENRRVHVMFEKQLNCDPLLDHDLPKNIYPLFEHSFVSNKQILLEVNRAGLKLFIEKAINDACLAEIRLRVQTQNDYDKAMRRLYFLEQNQKNSENTIQLLVSQLEANREQTKRLYQAAKDSFESRKRFGTLFQPDLFKEVEIQQEEVDLKNMKTGTKFDQLIQTLKDQLLISERERESQAKQIEDMSRQVKMMPQCLAENKQLKQELLNANELMKTFTDNFNSMQEDSSRQMQKLRLKMQEANETLQKKDKEIEENQKHMQSQAERVDTLTDQCDQLDTLLRNKNGIISELREQIVELNNNIVELKAKIQQLEQQLQQESQSSSSDEQVQIESPEQVQQVKSPTKQTPVEKQEVPKIINIPQPKEVPVKQKLLDDLQTINNIQHDIIQELTGQNIVFNGKKKSEYTFVTPTDTRTNQKQALQQRGFKEDLLNSVQYMLKNQLEYIPKAVQTDAMISRESLDLIEIKNNTIQEDYVPDKVTIIINKSDEKLPSARFTSGKSMEQKLQQTVTQQQFQIKQQQQQIIELQKTVDKQKELEINYINQNQQAALNNQFNTQPLEEPKQLNENKEPEPVQKEPEQKQTLPKTKLPNQPPKNIKPEQRINSSQLNSSQLNSSQLKSPKPKATEQVKQQLNSPQEEIQEQQIQIQQQEEKPKQNVKESALPKIAQNKKQSAEKTKQIISQKTTPNLNDSTNKTDNKAEEEKQQKVVKQKQNNNISVSNLSTSNVGASKSNVPQEPQQILKNYTNQYQQCDEEEKILTKVSSTSPIPQFKAAAEQLFIKQHQKTAEVYGKLMADLDQAAEVVEQATQVAIASLDEFNDVGVQVPEINITQNMTKAETNVQLKTIRAIYSANKTLRQFKLTRKQLIPENFEIPEVFQRLYNLAKFIKDRREQIKLQYDQEIRFYAEKSLAALRMSNVLKSDDLTMIAPKSQSMMRIQSMQPDKSMVPLFELEGGVFETDFITMNPSKPPKEIQLIKKSSQDTEYQRHLTKISNSQLGDSEFMEALFDSGVMESSAVTNSRVKSQMFRRGAK
ncbi:Conserved_hypothetical protein [Hexamita inflata]|uniref:Uncharacterized protein n=1 Tax=Hexamita inflata TaxID=28002 RepID=A0AA86NKL9_9EUKA|nr:Conserved hypothetical protein [Hexamita inflata]